MKFGTRVGVTLTVVALSIIAAQPASAQRPATPQPKPAARPAPRGVTDPGKAPAEARPAARRPGDPAAQPAARPARDANARRRPDASPAGAPTITGQVAAFVAGKSITVETRRRDGQTQRHEFTLDGAKTTIELRGDAKAITVGMTATVTADKDNPKLAVKVASGTPAGGGRVRPNPGQPAAPRNNNPANPNRPRRPAN